MKTALVLGAGGFIGSHMVKRLKKDGYWVRGVDLKYPEFSESPADEFVIGDLRNQVFTELMCRPYSGRYFDLVIQMAADMGGAGYIFTGEHDADVMHNSATINLNVLDSLRHHNFNGKIFYSSSACMYPQQIQEDTNNNGLKESDGYPGNPDSEYGWEKLFSERLYMAYGRNYNFNVRIARFHNIFGEEGTYKGGKEKAPAAIIRKVYEAEDGGYIEVWGDGLQTRSFLYIYECIEGVIRLLESNYKEPINIGSDEIISINDLARMAIKISGKELSIKNVSSNALGVRGRNSDNELCESVLNWRPTQPLRIGIEKLYEWIRLTHTFTYSPKTKEVLPEVC
jgi:nucleoside-diphosphate-sugar epimerase